MTPDLSIVVLSWNVAGLLAACLESLPRACGTWWERTEVLVVDNASADNSVEMVQRRFPGVRLLALGENLGFSGGNNVGIRAALGKYILLLNADTLPHAGSIEMLAGFLEENEETGIAGPRLLNPDGTLQPSRRRFPTLLTAFIESTPLQPLFAGSALLRRFYMLDRSDDEAQPVDWVSGAALMCRARALRQVGMLDPGYFMFSEEVDLCRRARNAGWTVAYLPQAQITHYGGQSTGQDLPARHIHFNTSKARYFRLHEGRTAGRFVRLYLLAMYGVQSISEAAKWVLGHKRQLRRERARLYAQVLRSRLKERQATRRDHVLMVTGEYPPARGGVGDYTCKLASALETRGLRTSVLTRRLRSKSTSFKQRDITAGPMPPLYAGTITRKSAMRVIRFSRAHIAHIQYQTGAFRMRPTINLLPLLLRVGWRGKTVVTCHDLLAPYMFPKAGPLREWINRVLARTADAVIATNPQDAARLRRWGVKHLHLIPIGSNISNTPPAGYDREACRRKWGAGPETKLLAYFGFLNNSKGLDDLLHALRRLREEGDFRLLMVGGGIGSSDPTNRATAAYLSRLANDLGVSDSIIWTGFLPAEEVSAALLSADMAVLPYADGASFRRGSLLAVLEHGLPVVTTLPASTEGENQSGGDGWPRLQHRVNALLVSPGDKDGLVSEIKVLSTDADLRRKLSEGAREVAAFFSWARIARLHVELYHELLDS